MPKFKGCQSKILKRYRKIFKTLLKWNFVLYTTVPRTWIYVEYRRSSSDLEKIVSLKNVKKLEFLRVAIATVTGSLTKFCMWIDLIKFYIIYPGTITLSLIASEIWAKN